MEDEEDAKDGDGDDDENDRKMIGGGGGGGGRGGWRGGEVAIPFEGALELVCTTPASSGCDCTLLLRKILLVLSHAECA